MDCWYGVYSVVQECNSCSNERDMSHHLNKLNDMMQLYSLDAASKEQWLTAELNFLSLFVEKCGFPPTPKFHMLQHIYLQFEYDCAPRFSYCFAEESKNHDMAEIARKTGNACDSDVPLKVMGTHECWAAAGYPTMAKVRAARVARLGSCSSSSKKRKINSDASIAADLDIPSDTEAAWEMPLDSDVDLEVP